MAYKIYIPFLTSHYAGTTYLLKKSDLTWEGGEVIRNE